MYQIIAKEQVTLECVILLGLIRSFTFASKLVVAMVYSQVTLYGGNFLST